jgi:cytochrome P450
MPVIISLWGANRNPEYVDDPEDFKPSRFMPGNKEKMHPYAFTSFGFGPRNCAGKRLATEMMLLLAAYLAKEFRFVKREYTKLQFLPAGLFFSAHEPIYFDVELRNKLEE